MWWSPGEQTVAFQIQINTLKKMFQIEDTVATPFQDFGLVVESFNKAAAGSVEKVIGDLLPPMRQGLQECVKALQLAILDPLDPVANFALGDCRRDHLVKDSRQLLTQIVSLFQFWRIPKQLSQHLALFRPQIGRVFTQRPHTALEEL